MVVGHEVVEYEDNLNLHIVYYQFRPDFIAKYTDYTAKKRFFNTPLGGKYWYVIYQKILK